MNIVTLLILVLLGMAVGFTVIMVQIISLARFQKARSWWAGAVAFILLAGIQIKGLVRLPSAIIQAQMKGYMIDELALEQRIDIVWSYLIVVAFIVFLDWLRRDWKRLGA